MNHYECQRCHQYLKSELALAQHEARCYPLRERPIRSTYAERHIKRRIELANTRFRPEVGLR